MLYKGTPRSAVRQCATLCQVQERSYQIFHGPHLFLLVSQVARRSALRKKFSLLRRRRRGEGGGGLFCVCEVNAGERRVCKHVLESGRPNGGTNVADN